MPGDEEPTVESRAIFNGHIINVRVDTIKLADGRLARREIVEHGDTIGVVPLDGNGNVLLVEQYRKPTGRRLLEVPAGGIQEGETPEQATLRELQEEVGYTAGKLQHLISFWLTPGFCTELMHAYLATELQPASLKPDYDENVRVVPTPLSEVWDLIENNIISDAKSVALLLMVMRMKRLF
jgi:ADP-ribose pyrophosphatase